ncbi:MAG: rRNA maturation RNase YbeY [bacterium]|nr:rRNA maturation RNase YbeY [bacterium]
MLTQKDDLVRIKVPHLPFDAIASAILGSSYELSLVFVGDTRMRKLNKQYRGKDRPTNILSFSYDEMNGEIVIDTNVAQKEARTQKRSFKKYLGFLFIHGCLHLKGLPHGHIMESKETHYLRRFLLQ